jgi:ankyrin repeat protein
VHLLAMSSPDSDSKSSDGDDVPDDVDASPAWAEAPPDWASADGALADDSPSALDGVPLAQRPGMAGLFDDVREQLNDMGNLHENILRTARRREENQRQTDALFDFLEPGRAKTSWQTIADFDCEQGSRNDEQELQEAFSLLATEFRDSALPPVDETAEQASLRRAACAGDVRQLSRIAGDRGKQVGSLLLGGNGDVTALHFAAAFNRVDAVRFLLEECDAHASFQHSPDADTPLHSAAKHGASDSIVVLLDAKADPLATSLDGCTPLHVAVAAGQWEAVSALLAGVDADTGRVMVSLPMDGDGSTPLHLLAKYAALHDLEATLKCEALLREHGADASSEDVHCRTPSHVASTLDVAQSLSSLPLTQAALFWCARTLWDPEVVDDEYMDRLLSAADIPDLSAGALSFEFAGQSLLRRACETLNVGWTAFLVSRGANVSFGDLAALQRASSEVDGEKLEWSVRAHAIEAMLVGAIRGQLLQTRVERLELAVAEIVAKES